MVANIPHRIQTAPTSCVAETIVPLGQFMTLLVFPRLISQMMAIATRRMFHVHVLVKAVCKHFPLFIRKVIVFSDFGISRVQSLQVVFPPPFLIHNF